MPDLRLSVVIPTLDRGDVLLKTIDAVLALAPRCHELIVVDQTATHPEAIVRELTRRRDEGAIRWLRLDRPSIPRAMNTGLSAAEGEVVLFLDDDIVPAEKLLAAHGRAHGAAGSEIIAGQVLQPGEIPEPLVGPAFRFRSSVAQPVREAMGGNFSVGRELARAIGGFDELFVGAAYRFEADFASRAIAAGGAVRFEPEASVRHLRAPRGGTRAFGSHLETFWPGHAVGEYYYLLRRRPRGAWKRFLTRPLLAVRTRHHLRRPWWIVPSLIAEAGAMVWALALVLRAPRLLPRDARVAGAGA